MLIFCVLVPMDLDVKIKAVMLGAVFLIVSIHLLTGLLTLATALLVILHLALQRYL